MQQSKAYSNKHAFFHAIEDIIQFLLQYDNYFGMTTIYIQIENSKSHFRNLKDDMELLFDKLLDNEDYTTIWNVYKIAIMLISKEYENHCDIWSNTLLDENTVEILNILLFLFEYIYMILTSLF